MTTMRKISRIVTDYKGAAFLVGSISELASSICRCNDAMKVLFDRFYVYTDHRKQLILLLILSENI